MSELIDNRAQRVRTLKRIIKRLHKGAPADGMPVEEVQSLSDLHSQVSRDVLVQLGPATVPAGHPVDTMRRENDALRDSLDRMQRAMNRILETADDCETTLLAWRQALSEVQDVDKHYQRKEHLFFACLEHHGINGPSKVMWEKDDQIRLLLKELSAELRKPDTTLAEWRLLAATTGAAAIGAVHEMFHKEEQILLPMCLDRFTEDEWAGIWASSPRYGWCLVEPRNGWRPATAVPAEEVPPGG